MTSRLNPDDSTGDAAGQMPCQLEERHWPTGERRLLLAILVDALHCATLRGGTRAQAIRREALVWLHGDDTRWPFSFLPICDVLGFDAGRVRASLHGGVEVERRGYRIHTENPGRRTRPTAVRHRRRNLPTTLGPGASPPQGVDSAAA